MHETPVVERNTQTGTIRIAASEATAIEVVGYAERCGSLDNVATVLAELSESLRGELLAEEAPRAHWPGSSALVICLSALTKRIWQTTSTPC